MVELTEEAPDSSRRSRRSRGCSSSPAWRLVPAAFIVVQAIRAVTVHLPVAGGRDAPARRPHDHPLRRPGLGRAQGGPPRGGRQPLRERVARLERAGGPLRARRDRRRRALADGRTRPGRRAPARPKGNGYAFRAPIPVRGEVVADLVADVDQHALPGRRHLLDTVAAELVDRARAGAAAGAEHEVAASLAEQNEQLRELDSMKDRFVSSVSHELRTPLTSMVGYLEILRDGEVGELSEEQEHVVEIIDRNCDRLNPLIGDILVRRRFDSGRRQLDRERSTSPSWPRTRSSRCRPSPSGKGVDGAAGGAPRAARRSRPTRCGSGSCSTTCSRTRSSSRPRAGRSR